MPDPDVAVVGRQPLTVSAERDRMDSSGMPEAADLTVGDGHGSTRSGLRRVDPPAADRSGPGRDDNQAGAVRCVEDFPHGDNPATGEPGHLGTGCRVDEPDTTVGAAERQHLPIGTERQGPRGRSVEIDGGRFPAGPGVPDVHRAGCRAGAGEPAARRVEGDRRPASGVAGKRPQQSAGACRPEPDGVHVRGGQPPATRIERYVGDPALAAVEPSHQPAGHRVVQSHPEAVGDGQASAGPIGGE
jgi:hypothetical protein